MNSMPRGTDEAVTTIYRNKEISEQVIETVARAKGTDPLELEPLYDVIDPDALDSLFRADGSQSSVELRFTMAGCEVVVRGDGEIVVTPPAAESDSMTVTHLDD